jgi:type II secretory pathway component PulF
MDKFVYTAYNKAGVRSQGELSAINMESAKFKLKELGLIPVKLDQVNVAAKKFRNPIQLSRKPRFSDLELLTSQLSLLLKNGIKIDRALETAQKGIKNIALRKIMLEVYDDVRKGMPLSDSLEKFPHTFDPLYTSIVKIGEATGKLPTVFADLASNLGFRKMISAKTRQAMLYPAIIFVVCMLAVIFIFNFIVPKFSVLFANINELPVYTHLLLVVSNIFQKYQFLGLAIFIILLIALKKLLKNNSSKRLIDGALLNIPVIRPLCYTLENFRFSSSLAVLLKSGVVLSDAFDYAVRSIGNVFLQKQLMLVKKEIKQGQKLSEAMAKTGFLPDIFEGLLEVAEQTGNLGEVFSEIEARMRERYEDSVTRLITLIEPIMILVMGLIVGSVVVVMLLSMVSISDIDF